MLNIFLILAIIALAIFLIRPVGAFVIVVGAVALIALLHIVACLFSLVESVVEYLTPFARRVRSFIRREARS